jgi:hypothetical protein
VVAALLLVLAPAVAPAQRSSGARALRERYYEAVQAFESGSHSRSLELLRRIERGLGSTNVRIQPYIILNMIALDRPERAIMEEIERYEQLGPPDTSFTNVIRDELRALRADERRRYFAARDENTVESYRRYLEQYPDGRYERQVRASLRSLERRAYEALRDDPSVRTARAYLDVFPSGRYADQVGPVLREEVQRRTSRERWGEADSLLDWTLQRRLISRDAAVRSLQSRIEEGLVWDRFDRRPSEKTAIAYLERYPDGRYASRVGASIAVTADAAYEKYFETGNPDQIDVALYWHDLYLQYLPNGADASRLRARRATLRDSRRVIRAPLVMAVPMKLGAAVDPSPDVGGMTAGFGFGTISEWFMALVEVTMLQSASPILRRDDERTIGDDSIVSDGDHYGVYVDDTLYSESVPFAASITVGFPLFYSTLVGIEGGVTLPSTSYRLVDLYRRYDQAYVGRKYLEYEGSSMVPVLGLSINQLFMMDTGGYMMLGLGGHARLRDLTRNLISYDVYVRLTWGINVNPFAN